MSRVVYARESHEPPCIFVPERKTKRRDTLSECNNGRPMKHRILVVTLLEIVVRNPRTEMVYVMESDTAGEPLQEGRKPEEGASRDRRRRVVPLLVVLPVRILELVLHEKEPQPGDDGEIVRGQIDQEDARTNERREACADDRDGGVGRPNTSDLAWPRVRSARRYPLLEHEEHGSQQEKHNWMSDDAVTEPPPPRACEVFSYRQRIHVAVSATIEVAR